MTGDACCSELGSVVLALIAQYVSLVDYQQGRRQPGELLGRRQARGGSDLRPLRRVRSVGVPEPLHCLAAEIVATGELVVGGGVHGGVGDRVVHRLLSEADVTAVFGHQRQRRGHVATDRFAGYGHPGGVHALGRAVARDPLGGGIALLDGDRVVRLR